MQAPTFDAVSLRCEGELPSRKLATSTDVGWTSVLLEHRYCDRTVDAFDTDPTPDQRIVVLTGGSMDLEAFKAGRWRKAVWQAGSAGLTPGGETSRLRWRHRRSEGFSRMAHLYVPQRFFDEAADHYQASGRPYRRNPLSSLAFHDPLIAQAVSALLAAMSVGAPDLYAQTTMQWLAMHLLSMHSNWLGHPHDHRDPGVISDARVRQVIEFMSAHFAAPLSLERLAKEANISKFHFARLFREKTGVAPHTYLVQLRMEAASGMLATTDLNVAEIAAECGYRSAAHFGAAFRRRFNDTPTMFRTRVRTRSHQLDPGHAAHRGEAVSGDTDEPS